MEMAMIQQNLEAFVQNTPEPLKVRDQVVALMARAERADSLDEWTEQMFFKQLNTMRQRRQIEHDRARLVRLLQTARMVG